MISSYKAAQLHMEKARSKAKGRPMKGTGWRLFQDGDEYVVTVHEVQVGRFLPDNTFMFTLRREQAYSVAQVMSGTMHRNLPFRWARVAHKTYRVDHHMNIPTHRSWEHFQRPTNAPMVYDGLKFDLSTGECRTYRPDTRPVVDPERRKEWLAASRAWKRKLKIVARIGGLDALIAAERQNPTPWGQKPKWASPSQVDILYKAIKDGDLSTDLLRQFMATVVHQWGPTPTSMDAYGLIERIITAQSKELRMLFGVFEEDVHDGKIYI